MGAGKPYTVASHPLEQELPSCRCASSGKFNLRFLKDLFPALVHSARLYWTSRVYFYPYIGRKDRCISPQEASKACKGSQQQRKGLTLDTLQENFTVALHGWDVPTCLRVLSICRHAITPRQTKKKSFPTAELMLGYRMEHDSYYYHVLITLLHLMALTAVATKIYNDTLRSAMHHVRKLI